jgi:hypothetical protein
MMNVAKRGQPKTFPDYESAISGEELQDLIRRAERAMALLSSILEREGMAERTLDSLGDLSHLEARYPEEFAEIETLSPNLISGLAGMQALADMSWDLEEWLSLKNTPESAEGIGEPPVSSRISGAKFVEGITRIPLGAVPDAPAPLYEFFPHHAMLDRDQRNTYAYWIDSRAQGNIFEIYDSYIALRAFELINGRGWVEPEDGAAELIQLWLDYHESSPALAAILWRWTEDFIFAHHIEGGLDHLYDSYSRYWIMGPFPDHVVQRLLERPLSLLPMALVEELGGLEFDQLESFVNGDIDYFEKALQVVLFTLDVEIRATASPAGMFGRISPKKKIAKATVAFEGALYGGKRTMVELPPVAPYHSSEHLSSLIRAIVGVVDLEVVRQLDEEADPLERAEFGNDQHRHIAGIVAQAIDGYDRELGLDSLLQLEDDAEDVTLGTAVIADLEDDEDGEIDWSEVIPEEYHKVLDSFDPADIGGPAARERLARLDAADWDSFYADLTRTEYDVLHVIANSVFPLSQVRAVAKASDRSLNQIFRAINTAGRTHLGTGVVDATPKQPRLEALVATPILLQLADQPFG